MRPWQGRLTELVFWWRGPAGTVVDEAGQRGEHTFKDRGSADREEEPVILLKWQPRPDRRPVHVKTTGGKKRKEKKKRKKKEGGGGPQAAVHGSISGL